LSQCDQMGASIFEHTLVYDVQPGAGRKRPLLRCNGASVRADVVVRAVEAWTASLPGHRRELIPVYSLMIATEPLPQAFWEVAGLSRRETFSDHRRLIVYGQRTADGRIAFGGRGGAVPLWVRGSWLVRPGTAHTSVPRREPRRTVPRRKGLRGNSCLGRAARRAPRLVFVSRPRPGLGFGMGWRVRGRRSGYEQPGRPDHCRPGPRSRQRPRTPSLGSAPFPALGARTTAMARSERGHLGNQAGRPCRRTPAHAFTCGSSPGTVPRSVSRHSAGRQVLWAGGQRTTCRRRKRTVWLRRRRRASVLAPRPQAWLQLLMYLNYPMTLSSR